MYEYIYNKGRDRGLHFDKAHLNDDITWEKDSWYLAGGDDKSFYYVIQPYKYKSIKQLRKFLESFTKDETYIQEMLHETSNPIIFIAEHKI